MDMLTGSSKFFPRPPVAAAPPPQTQVSNANLYPWSQQELVFGHGSQNPFPRYGAAVNSVSSKDGDIYIMGGLVDGQTVKGDLWVVESMPDRFTCYPVRTEQEGPGPRVGHASLLVGNAYIVFGGDTKQDENDELDDALYLLNTCRPMLPSTSLILLICKSSYETLVASTAPGRTTCWSIWSHLEHIRL